MRVMDKVLKVLRSRYLLSAFVIVVEFILLLLVFLFFYMNFSIMVVLSYLFYIGVFLYIINKYKSPEFKLPWVIILLLFSVIGAYIFVILVGSDDTKKTSKKYRKVKGKLRDEIKSNNYLKELEVEEKEAYLQAKYITDSMQLPCYKNSKVSYFKIGEDFHKELLSSLKKAEKYIFMEYFIIEEGKMWDPIYEILKEKSKNGVKVYVMYDDFGCMATLKEDYYKKLNGEGINCIPSNKFRPVLSNFHNFRDHRKITVIDGKVGFTGGINLADEYINEKVKHGHWKDTAIKIEGEAVQNLIILFLESWNIQNKKQLEYKDFEVETTNIKNDNGIVIPYGDGPEEFYEESIGKNVYLNMINSSKEYIYITTPYLICDYEILDSLCLAAKKGVDVRIIVPHIPDKETVFLMTKSNYNLLIKNGVKIYEYTPGFIHAKSFISDDKYAVCGTINLDYRSLVHHFECGSWMYNTTCIKDMKKDFIETLEVSEEISLKRARLKGWKKLLAEVMKVFSPLF